MMQHSNLPKRTYSPLSAAASFDEECVPSAGDRIHPGVTYLPEKVDKYRTTQGDMTLEELNQRCKQFVPKLCTEPYRYLDDTWVKHHYDTPLADELYKLEQQSSRKLNGKGAGLTRSDINALADK